MKKIIVGGSTGVIGKKTLNIIENNPNDLQVMCLIANKNINSFKFQINKFHPKYVIFGEKITDLPEGTKQINKEELESIFNKSDIFINGISGIAGLQFTAIAVKTPITIALANKESLVIGYEYLKKINRTFLKNIIPVDSEHSAIYQLLKKVKKSEIDKIILTASGGVIKNTPIKGEITNKEILNHPNWNMGKIITVDSSTMVNKAYEVMEAHFLFHEPIDKIDVLFHPQSVIHGLIQFYDGNYFAHLSPTDMYFPIKYALYGERRMTTKERLRTFLSKLELQPINYELYPNFQLMINSLQKAPMFRMGIVYGNEEIVKLFLKGKIKFKDIFKYNELIQQHFNSNDDIDFQQYPEIKRKIRDIIERFTGGNK